MRKALLAVHVRGADETLLNSKCGQMKALFPSKIIAQTVILHNNGASRALLSSIMQLALQAQVQPEADLCDHQPCVDLRVGATCGCRLEGSQAPDRGGEGH